MANELDPKELTTLVGVTPFNIWSRRALLVVLLWWILYGSLSAYAQLAPGKGCDSLGEWTGTSREVAERAYRAMMREHYPDMEESKFNFYFEAALQKQRARILRKQALCILMREKYPHLSQAERDILVEDQLGRETSEQQRRDLAPLMTEP